MPKSTMIAIFYGRTDRQTNTCYRNPRFYDANAALLVNDIIQVSFISHNLFILLLILFINKNEKLGK